MASPARPVTAASECMRGLGASSRTCADLKRQPIQVLLSSGLKELAHILNKLMIFKNSNPGNERPSCTGFLSNGKHKVWLIDMFDPTIELGTISRNSDWFG